MCCIDGTIALYPANAVDDNIEQAVTAPDTICLQHYENYQ